MPIWVAWRRAKAPHENLGNPSVSGAVGWATEAAYPFLASEKAVRVDNIV